ncbi:MAG: DNA cytosine methyltransferase, partial [Chloroflexota bacterium]
MPLSTRLTATDLFCGAGGSSQGAADAGAEIFLAVNHWELALETHSANFPETLHDHADISATDPRRYPSTTLLLASPECTHHSYAAGRRKPKRQRSLFEQQELDEAAERSRATMWDVVRFSEFHDYELVIVENVVESRKWAPFASWMGAMDSLGYRGKVLYLNSMFFHPTPQSRDRMYVVFWKKGNKTPALEFRPRAWCGFCEGNVEAVQSWKNPNKRWGKWGRYRRQYVYRCPACAGEVEPYYYAAANVIDWSDLGERIGDRDRPLAKRTMDRIRKGLEAYGNQGLLVQLAYSHANSNRSRPVARDPLPSQTTQQSVALLTPMAWLASVNYFRPDHQVTKP